MSPIDVLRNRKRHFIMKISTKLLLIVVLATALTGIAALYGVLSSANLLESQIKEKFTAVSTYAIEKVHRLFSRRYEDIARLAKDPIIISRRSTPRQITEKLREYKRHFGSYIPYASLSFFDLKKRRVAGTDDAGIGAREAIQGYWTALAKGGDFALDVSSSESLKGGVFHLAHMVRDRDGAAFGVVVADIPLESLQEIAARPLGLFQVGSTFGVDLIDAKGLVLFSTYNRQGVLRDISPIYDFVKKTRAGNGLAGTILLPDALRKEDRKIVVFARAANDASYPWNDWTLVISLPERAALAPLVALKNRLIVVFICIGSIAFGVVLVLSRTITNPLARLSRSITEVGKGNLDAVVEVSSSDEIGRLSAVFNKMVRELKQFHDQLRDAATLDGLTGAFNRNKIDELLQQEVARAGRYETPLSLILFDLDHFKSINDTYGHLSGDSILKTVVDIVKDNIRRTDFIGRWGGEEFMVLAPGIELEQAAELADKIRSRVENFSFAAAGAVTISCGVATFKAEDTAIDLIKRADDALYLAKDKGRNAVEINE